MRLHSKVLQIQTLQGVNFLPLSSLLEKEIESLGVKSGFLLLSCPHTTAGLIVNENDPTVLEDLRGLLESIFSLRGEWTHTFESKRNAQAHQVSILLGSQLWFAIQKGRLELGTWQEIFFVEGDGPRKRSVNILIVHNEE